MTEEDKTVLDQDEYESLTPNQKEQYVESLKAHKSLAIEKLNEILKELSIRGEGTELEILKSDDTKKIQKVNRPGNVKHLPQTINGPDYPQVFDTTGIPRSNS